MFICLVEPSAPPANVQGHNTSSTSIWVDWDIVPVADQNGIIHGIMFISSLIEWAKRATRTGFIS